MFSNKVMNTIIATTAFIVSTALSAALINPCSYESEVIEEQVTHDWECTYIVEDFYTQEGGSMVHYVDEVVENVDGSITFIAEDGLLTTIPYPYYSLEKNPNKND
jgi:hypothetical protein